MKILKRPAEHNGLNAIGQYLLDAIQRAFAFRARSIGPLKRVKLENRFGIRCSNLMPKSQLYRGKVKIGVYVIRT